MPEGLPDINLLPKYERQSASTYYVFIAMIIILFTSLLFLGCYFFLTKHKLQETEAKYEQLNIEAEGLKAQVEQLESGGTPSLEQAVSFVESHSIPTSVFITELNDLLPEQSYLSEYEYGSQVAKVTVDFETLDIVAGYTTKLIKSDLIKDTKIDEVETFVLKEEEQEENQVMFDTIPRYKTVFTLQVDKQKLKGESREDE